GPVDPHPLLAGRDPDLGDPPLPDASRSGSRAGRGDHADLGVPDPGPVGPGVTGSGEESGRDHQAQAEDGAVRTHGNLRFRVPEAANPDGPRRRPVDLLHPPRFRTVAPGGGMSGTCAAAPLWTDFPRSPRSHPLRSRSPCARTSEAPVQFVFRAAPPVSGGVRSRRPPSECSMPSPHLRAHALGFAYPSTPSLFEDLSFHLPAGWTGLVGANGSGKSTLLGLLQGRLRPTFGQLERVPERQAIHLCPQEVERLDPLIEAFAEA